MLDLTRKLPPVAAPVSLHDWTEYARAKDQGTFGRKSHRLCRRCGVICRPDTEFAPCNSTAPKKDKPC